MNEPTQSLAGHLLIAMPNLADPNFWQSVVLLGVHSNDEGAFGLVVNRSLDIDLQEILEELGEEVAPGELPGVLGGGPVQPNHGFVLFERGLHEAGDDEITVSDSIVLSGNTETLARLTRRTDGTRYFLLLGYAGWHPGQLEREIEENSWVVAPLDTSILFDVPVEERWAAALKSIGIDPGTLVDGGSTEPS
ncbi:MAG: YqgE/AlgH family protein [Acidobacteria bacterium]|jgi:putative transcriptional regulator|nr:YqgE/AlgH family protein [Acidobacteriota bacterium]